MASKELKSIIQKEIDATKKYNSDINGIGKMIYKSNPKYWRQIENKWYDIFDDIDYKINVELNMKHKGSITSSILEETK